MSEVYGFVLAGGSGKRFWPLSREMSPKQLLSIFGTEALVVDAVRRLAEIPDARPERIAVLTNERLADELGNTLACCSDEWVRRVRVLVEPLGRDSAPAAALCAAVAEHESPQALVALLPSNQVLTDTAEWRRAAREALAAADSGGVATFVLGAEGEIGSDVIFARASALLAAIASHPAGAVTVEAARTVAQEPLAEWTSDSVRDRFSAVEPFGLGAVLSLVDVAVTRIVVGESVRQIADFRALAELSDPDPAGNHRIGRGVDVDSERCIIHSTDRLVCTLGLRDTVVVDTTDATLVCSADRASDVRKVADTLARNGEPEATMPKVSLRPWGTWTSLVKGPGYQMKVIVVEVGKRVSLQSHVHRSEHWVVVEGIADVTLDERVVRVPAGRSVYIPSGVVHRMENAGDVPLKIVEVQVGGYLGEDDIVRYEDDYDRAQR